MRRVLIVGVLCLALPALSWAAKDPPWWHIDLDVPSGPACVADKPGGGMFDIICLLGDTQMPHRIEDTTEGGQVMVTTIIAPQLSKEPLMYFRTKERCQQEMRERAAAYKAGQQQRERQLDRYR